MKIRMGGLQEMNKDLVRVYSCTVNKDCSTPLMWELSHWRPGMKIYKLDLYCDKHKPTLEKIIWDENGRNV